MECLGSVPEGSWCACHWGDADQLCSALGICVGPLEKRLETGRWGGGRWGGGRWEFTRWGELFGELLFDQDEREGWGKKKGKKKRHTFTHVLLSGRLDY